MNKPDNASAHLAKDYDSKIRSTIPYYDSFHEEIFQFGPFNG